MSKPVVFLQSHELQVPFSSSIWRVRFLSQSEVLVIYWPSMNQSIVLWVPSKLNKKLNRSSDGLPFFFPPSDPSKDIWTYVSHRDDSYYPEDAIERPIEIGWIQSLLVLSFRFVPLAFSARSHPVRARHQDWYNQLTSLARCDRSCLFAAPPWFSFSNLSASRSSAMK